MDVKGNDQFLFQYPSFSLEIEESRKNLLSDYPITESISHLGTHVTQVQS
jgi:hypothetical protein